MNENIDLTKILKDCPKGTKLYSTVHGEVIFINIDSKRSYPITVILSDTTEENFTSEGKLVTDYDGECTLFPSKSQRDWSKFKPKKEEFVYTCKFKVGDKIVDTHAKYMGASVTQGVISKITDDKYIFSDGSYTYISNQNIWELVPDKKPKFDPNTLNPFDKVLARDDNNATWFCRFFSHILDTTKIYRYYATDGGLYKYCIPYNDDTKHLVSKNDEAPEFYRYWEN